MRILSTALFVLIMSAAAIAAEGNGDKGSYTVDVELSQVTWKGYKVTGQHNGTIELKEGSVEMRDGALVGGQFVMDMTSITVLDLKGDSKAKLEGHLKSDDFFGVETHTTSTLVITDVVSKDQGFWVTADLTIKGITEPVEFMAYTKEENGKTIATADLKVDRSKYDVRYGSNSFFDNLGDKAIYDDFDLSVAITVVPQGS